MTNPNDTKNLAVCESSAAAAMKRGIGYVNKGEFDLAIAAFSRASAWANRARTLVIERRGGKLV